MSSSPSSEGFSTDVAAVFTSDAFDHPAHDPTPIDEENFDENYPCAGREFALALECAFALECDRQYLKEKRYDKEEEVDWEHGGWLLWLEHESRTFDIRLWPLPTETPLWSLWVEENRGCLMSLFGLGNIDRIPRSLQRRLQAIVEEITDTKDLRWTTEEKVSEMI